jgi:cbb3-type cytochrome oxidase subunit 1
MQVEKFSYDNKIVRNFAIATFVWGIVGMLVGVIAALQLIYPQLNFIEYALLRAAQTTPHQRGDFCVCGQWYFYGRVLLAPALDQSQNVE